MSHTLPAGLLDHHYEFFVDADAVNAYCINHGRVMAFEDFPEELLEVIELQISRLKRAAINARGIYDRLGVIKEFLMCNYGGFDHVPDMVDGVLQQPEFWSCPQRGHCAQEGILCERLQTESGRNLSHTEVKIIKLTAQGMLDKEIAGHLKISHHTVGSHTRNIRSKTGLLRKSDLTRFAHQNNLV